MFILSGLQGWGGQGEGGEVTGGLQPPSVLNGSVLLYWPGPRRGLEGQGDSLDFI